ncbi:MAG: Gfo/Idh/MocA family oxidoreductase [Nitrospiraceae bacterium]|nr:Gfo/Idh/MocA family oxidoreductase [Nitrospiraceae bacterium]
MGAAAGVMAAATGHAQVTQARPKPGKVRIGIVGGRFGSTFQWHLDPQCEVVAVCDIDDTVLNCLKDVYHCDNGYKSFREMFKHPDMNAVGVYTPAPLHVWVATDATSYGRG